MKIQYPLSPCDYTESSCYTRPRLHSTSKYKGVSWFERDKKWYVYFSYKGIHCFVGSFDDEIEAAKAYDRVALYYHRDFAYLNFPDDAVLTDDPPECLFKQTHHSKYRGVTFHVEKDGGKWNARITVKGKTIHIGDFKTEEDAAHAYDVYARIYYGNNAILNFADDIRNEEWIATVKYHRPYSCSYRGVSYNKARGLWMAYVNKPKRTHVGYFKTAFEAAKQRDKFIVENQLSVKLNFPEDYPDYAV